MAYADLLDKENINSQYLAVVTPRRQITGTWANPSGTLYTISFDYGLVSELRVDDEAKDEASDITLAGGDWFYDIDSQTLYFDDGSNPNTTGFFTVFYELFLATFDAYFNRNPLDANSLSVYYEPLIVKSPQILQNISDTFFGFYPSQTSSVVLSTATAFFQRHVYDSSFNQAPFKLYHYLGELKTDNIKQVVDGVCGNLRYDDQTLNVTIYDANQIFNQFFRNNLGASYFNTTNFPNLDPNFLAKPIRRVCGIVNGFIPVNVDYNFDTPLTTNNRKWVVVNGDSASFDRATSISFAPASTATRTYLNSVVGITRGDTVFKQSSGGPAFDETFIVTNVDRVSNYVEHAAVTTVGVGGEAVFRAFVASVTIVQDGVKYDALYRRDYTTFVDVPTFSSGFLFESTLEANLGMPRTLRADDLVFCKVYNNIGAQFAGGGGIGPIGSGSPISGELANPVNVILGLLDTFLQIDSNALINEQSFIDAEAVIDSELGFAIPRFATAEFPKYRDILGEIFQSELIKIAFDDDNKIKIEVTGPFGASDKTIADDEILKGSTRFEYEYGDIISDAIVEYAGSEVNNRNEALGTLSYQTVRTQSDVAINLHQIKKQKTFQSLHFIESDAQTLADRLSYALGDRRGLIRFRSKNRFFNTEIDDRIDIQRDRMPGFVYERGTDRTRSGAVISSTKSLDQITIEVDDQKGIQDNEGSW